MKFCREHDIAANAYRPLCFVKGGQNLVDNEVIKKIAAKHGKTPAQVILCWGIQKDFVVIPKSSNPVRMAENLGAEHFSLDESDLAEIAKLDVHLRTCTASPLFGSMTEGEFWDNE